MIGAALGPPRFCFLAFPENHFRTLPGFLFHAFSGFFFRVISTSYFCMCVISITFGVPSSHIILRILLTVLRPLSKTALHSFSDIRHAKLHSPRARARFSGPSYTRNILYLNHL
jgi:hypothetical protein